MNKTKKLILKRNQYLSHTFRRRSVISAERIAKNGLKNAMIVERYEDKSNI
jgi:hypothetical protein